MKKVICKEIKEIDFKELKSLKLTALEFEDPSNWYLTYAVQKLDYMMEYSQSSGRGEICGVCVDTVSEGEIALNFTADGRANAKILNGYVSEEPTWSRNGTVYYKLIKK